MCLSCVLTTYSFLFSVFLEAFYETVADFLFQTKKYADVIIPRGADNTGMSHQVQTSRNTFIKIKSPPPLQKKKSLY